MQSLFDLSSDIKDKHFNIRKKMREADVLFVRISKPGHSHFKGPLRTFELIY